MKSHIMMFWTARGSNPGGGKWFPFTRTSRPTLGSTQTPIWWVAGFFPGCKLAQAWI